MAALRVVASWPSDFARVRYRTIIVLLTCALGLLYVGYQSVQGERGLLRWVERSAEVERTRAEVATLADERRKLERRVSQLRSESLDLDLLDQEARRLLNPGSSGRRGPVPRPARARRPRRKRVAAPQTAVVVTCHGKHLAPFPCQPGPFDLA